MTVPLIASELLRVAGFGGFEVGRAQDGRVFVKAFKTADMV
jgi:hypothetical protein